MSASSIFELYDTTILKITPGPYYGPNTVDGVSKIDGVAARCRVTLLDARSLQTVAYMRTPSSGIFVFTNIADGKYYLLIEDDRQDVKNPRLSPISLP